MLPYGGWAGAPGFGGAYPGVVRDMALLGFNKESNKHPRLGLENLDPTSMGAESQIVD